MSRPRPLTNLTSALPDLDEYGALTPRTPHSRTARAEGGFAKLQIFDGDDHEFQEEIPIAQQQSAPLLASSTSARFTSGLRSGKGAALPSRYESLSPFSRLLLVFGVFLAGILFILIVLSFTRPEALHRYVGAKLPSNAALKAMPSTTQPHQPHIHDAHIISYENYTVFPLHPNEYLAECRKLISGYMLHGDYWDLPLKSGLMDVEHDANKNKGVCKSTITYMLDGKVGLAADLALMAQAAALSRDRNRTFFIDDTYWNRGKWSDHFEDVRVGQPGPEPGCHPPPPEELVACPRNARHWVINSRTAKYHFGHGFSNHYENPYAHQLNRLKPMFDFAVESFHGSIKPNTLNTQLINVAKQELTDLIASHGDYAIPDEPTTSDSRYLAVHIRRGDRKPESYEFHQNYIPIHDYIEAVSKTWPRIHGNDGELSNNHPVIYVASDSPAAIHEFMTQYQGVTFTLAGSGHPRLKELASPSDYYQNKFDMLPEQERILLSRGAIVDLALISGLWGTGNDIMPSGTICAVSSNFCRLAAVGLSWDGAFGDVSQLGDIDETRRKWVDVDLKGHIVPVWRPFELF